MFEKQAKVVESTRPDEGIDDFIVVEDLIFLAIVAIVVAVCLMLALVAWLIA